MTEMVVADMVLPDCPLLQWPTEDEPWAVWQIGDDGIWPIARFASAVAARAEANRLMLGEDWRFTQCNAKRQAQKIPPIARRCFGSYVATKESPAYLN